MIILPLIWSFFIGLAGAWFMARFGPIMGFVDLPGGRSSHRNPTPLAGGIGIPLTLGAVSSPLGLPWTLWLPVLLLAAVSLYDDWRGVPALLRLLIHFVLAAIVLTGVLPFAGYPFTPAAVLAGAIFLVGTANFFNFMDGIDGIAGLSGMVGFSLLGLTAFLSGSEGGGMLLPFCMAATCLGFLPFNLPRARVFMGDVGSVTLGFLFAACILANAGSWTLFAAMGGCLFPFYADTLSTLYIRWRAGEQLTQAHRQHLYQILVHRYRYSHLRATTAYVVLQIIVGGASVAIVSLQGGLTGMLCLLFISFAGFFWVGGRVRVGEISGSPGAGSP